MRDAGLVALALACSLAGMGWLALAMDVHWQQVRGGDAGPGARAALALRVLAVGALVASLALLLAVDHPSIAVLVWIMSLVVASLVVTFTLATRPRWLRALARVVARRPGG